MRRRGLHELEAHIGSFDPDAPTARQRLEAALGEPFTQELLRVLLSSAAYPQAGEELSPDELGPGGCGRGGRERNAPH
jgi:hypothetical protein